ncbi:hypothetical protein D0N36_14315 [Hymenobacter lapidiphilus]|uniref:hypothetical protein n=1 Tax=Hymenobacter sp. CCM 8763 TaxID=2303334 RepID=UPI000E3577EE|nr:hypothetical protein [Hymenobacter sp. CCM 8763]RFP64360.1 hypothetical protein D0N36_14315 [Hymenobacter sp. CCM 8763]
MNHELLLASLCHSGHLRPLADEHYRRQEQQSLLRLLANPRRTFLQDYDVLFRYVSLWLLARGYVLSNHQPHQVLSRVCGQLAPPALVQQVVSSRHAIKYDGRPPTPAAVASLSQLTAQLQAAVGTGPIGR